jgi:hypothetical protein
MCRELLIICITVYRIVQFFSINYQEWNQEKGTKNKDRMQAIVRSIKKRVSSIKTACRLGVMSNYSILITSYCKGIKTGTRKKEQGAKTGGRLL